MLINDITTVSVELGQRSYDILINDNLLHDTAKFLSPFLRAKRVAVVTDETVYALYGAQLEKALSGYDVHMIVRPSGESQKSFEGLQAVLNSLFEAEFDRNDTLIAFGGGVIGDLTGFAASIYKRGCQFVQMPTTLLAQVDSSVGGKTAINNQFGKNLIGAFYQPKLVIADTAVLKTLPERELKAGYAEVLKYGLLGDLSFFQWLNDNGPEVLNLTPKAIAYAVKISCQTKARIVAADEEERGQRALLNLGHTFGHALELEAGYSGDLLALQSHIKKTNLISLADVKHLLKNADALMKHMEQDKKNEGGTLTFILNRGIGEAFIQKATPRAAILTYLKTLESRYA